MKKKYFALLSVLMIMLPFLVRSQSSINAAGGQANSITGSVSFSVGQWAYQANTSAAGTVEQGVQHAYEIAPLGNYPMANNMLLTVFPNPTTQDITLVVSDPNSEKLSYQLFDSQGKLISANRIVSENTPINMSGLASATYYLHILKSGKQKLKSFSILKNL